MGYPINGLPTPNTPQPDCPLPESNVPQTGQAPPPHIEQQGGNTKSLGVMALALNNHNQDVTTTKCMTLPLRNGRSMKFGFSFVSMVRYDIHCVSPGQGGSSEWWNPVGVGGRMAFLPYDMYGYVDGGGFYGRAIALPATNIEYILNSGWDLGPIASTATVPWTLNRSQETAGIVLTAQSLVSQEQWVIGQSTHPLNGRPIRWSDRNGNTVYYTYAGRQTGGGPNGAYLLRKMTGDLLVTPYFVYATNGSGNETLPALIRRIVYRDEVLGASGDRATYFEYSDDTSLYSCRIKKVINPGGCATTYDTICHSADGSHPQITAETDADGYTTTWVFDSTSVPYALLKGQEPNGRTIYFNYNGTTQQTRLTTQGRSERFWSYDNISSRGGAVQLRRARGVDGRTTYFDWDTSLPSGGTYHVDAVQRRIYPSGRETYFAYHGPHSVAGYAPQLAGEVERLDGGAKRSKFYDYNGLNMTKRTEWRSTPTQPATTYFIYDGQQNRIGTVNPLNGTEWRIRDSKGRVIKAVTPLNRATYFAMHPTIGRPVCQIDPCLATTYFTYDGWGNVATEISPRWVETGSYTAWTTTKAYTPRNQVRKSTDPYGGTTYFDYWGRGDLLRQVDPNQVQTLRSMTGMRQLASTKVVDAGGTARTWTYYTYDTHKNRIGQVDALGRRTYFAFDDSDRQFLQRDALGHLTYFGYDTVDNRVLVRDALGRSTRRIFDLADRVRKVQDASGATVYYAYNAADSVTSVMDPRLGVTTWAYDLLERPTKQQGARGYTAYYNYNASNLTSAVDAANKAVYFTYDPADRLASAKDPANGITYFGYDAVGNTVVRRRPRGFAWTTTYDRLDRICTQVDPTAGTTYFGYDAVGNLVKQRDPNGNQTLFTVDALRRRTLMTDAVTGTTYFGYDRVGNLVVMQDQRGYRWRQTYDALNRLATWTDPWNSVTYYGYDAVGNRTVFQDGRGNRTRIAVDPVNRPQYITDARSGVTYWGYDGNGNRVKERDALLRTTLRTYDAENHLVAVEDALGGRTYYAYDARGDRTLVRTARRATIDLGYDALRRVTKLRDGTSQTAYFNYDANGNVTSVRDANLQVTSLAYDTADRVSQITNPLTQAVTFAYDAAGNRRKEADAANVAVYYTYDALNRLATQIDQLQVRTYFIYDAASNLLAQRTVGVGDATTVGYDMSGRKRFVQSNRDFGNTGGYGVQAYGITPYGGGSTGPSAPTQYFAYDAAGNLQTVTTAGGQANLGYDELNRLVKHQNLDGFTAYYGYDAVGNRTKIAIPSTSYFVYAYDTLNRLVGARQTTGPANSAFYNATGSIVKRVYGNGSLAYYVYDGAERVTSIQHLTSALAPIATLAYGRDNAGRIRKIAREDNRTIYYGYDAADRLTAEVWGRTGTTTQLYAFSYAYNSTGLRTKLHRQGGSGGVLDTTYYSYRADGAPRKRFQIPAQVATYYAYDAAGSLTRLIEPAVGTTYFIYTTAGLIGQIIPPPATGAGWSFGYDGLLNRTRITKAGTQSYYVWDGLNQIEERDGTGALVAAYTHMPGPIAGVGSAIEVNRPATGRQFLHLDHQGTAQAISDSAQTVQVKTVLDAFGRQVGPNGGATPTLANELGFQSNWLTVTIGNRRYCLSPSRVYDPELGMFLQRDPLPNALKAFEYTKERSLGIYAGTIFEKVIREVMKRKKRDPLFDLSKPMGPNSVDPTGFFTLLELLIVIAIIVILAILIYQALKLVAKAAGMTTNKAKYSSPDEVPCSCDDIDNEIRRLQNAADAMDKVLQGPYQDWPDFEKQLHDMGFGELGHNNGTTGGIITDTRGMTNEEVELMTYYESTDWLNGNGFVPDVNPMLTHDPHQLAQRHFEMERDRDKKIIEDLKRLKKARNCP